MMDLTLAVINFLLNVQRNDLDSTVDFVTTYLFDVLKHEQLLSVFQRRFIINEAPQLCPLRTMINWVTNHLQAFQLLYFNGDQSSSMIHPGLYQEKKSDMFKALLALLSLKSDLIRIEQTIEWSDIYSDLHDYIHSTNRQLNEILSKRRTEMQVVHNYIAIHQDRILQLEQTMSRLEQDIQQSKRPYKRRRRELEE